MISIINILFEGYSGYKMSNVGSGYGKVIGALIGAGIGTGIGAGIGRVKAAKRLGYGGLGKTSSAVGLGSLTGLTTPKKILVSGYDNVNKKKNKK